MENTLSNMSQRGADGYNNIAHILPSSLLSSPPLVLLFFLPLSSSPLLSLVN